ncbi:MAG: nitrite/sulfite reductase [Acidobacteriota bacterium]|nr:nitrite/sulfite reductase [Acidobacteriota bacterium]
MSTWKDQLVEQINPVWGEEIDVFETQLEQRRQGKLDEKIFAETRLRRGVYGQRYDNGQRHDGIRTQELSYPSGSLTKGPETAWDAPGMQRIKIPFGGVTPDQMDVLADLSEEYSDSILHVTTRQDFQLHFVHIDDTPDLMRRLAAAGITTREACGNSVRNVTACPLAGVCRDETFDVTPYAIAISQFLLGHPDVQDFGRKFKIAFSGCRDQACGLVSMHDMGLIAVTKNENGKEKRGFECYVGGGLGAVPHQAKLFDSFLPEEELLPTAQAIARVFARLGEKNIRSRARIKFLVANLGIDEFRRLVREEREAMSEDERWTAYLPDVQDYQESAVREGQAFNGAARPEGFQEWYETNVYHQRQDDYGVATITLPLGDLSAWQMRELADLARRFAGENVRTTVEQNVVLRWVSQSDLPDLYQELERVGLNEPGAGSIIDVTACPGTDTCKLGIASSLGLAGEIRTRLAGKFLEMDQAVRNLRIKISGCFNSCGQHHIADIGFYGTSRTLSSRKVPHFQLVLGGKWTENAGSYGLAMGSVPAKRIPEVLERITERYVKEKTHGQSFQDFIRHIGKLELRNSLEDLMTVPAYEEDSTFYSDWGDPREFTLGDMGIGECAGEVVSLVDFDLAAAERLVFEAQVKLDEEDYSEADGLAYGAMLQSARALIKTEFLDVADDSDTLVGEFRKRFYDTELFHNQYAGGKFAHYLFRRYESPPREYTRDHAHTLVEEAQLFIEAAHACWERIAQRQVAAASASGSTAGPSVQ